MTLAQKIANARKLFKDIKKDTQGYDYKYADLDSIMTAIKEGLISEGLNVHHTVKPVDIFGGHFFEVTCHVTDGDKELTSTVHMPWKEPTGVDKYGKPKQVNLLHEMGKVITYGRRYSLSSALCLTADEDTDAQDKPSKEPVYEKKAETPKPSPTPSPIRPNKADEAKASVQRVHAIREAQQKSGIFTASEAANKWLDTVMDRYQLSDDSRSVILREAEGKTAQELEILVQGMASGQA